MSNYKSHLKFIRSLIQHCGSHFATKVPKLSSLYYFLLSNAFDVEHHSTLAGVREHRRNTNGNAARYALRRSIHRLEKGLTMRPRRPTFGESYIERTVSLFNECQSEGRLSSDEAIWCRDVLEAYFSTVTHTATIGRALDSAKMLLQVTSSSNTSVPGFAYERDPHSVSYDQLKGLALHRSSVRWFEQTEVPLDLIRKAIVVGSTAPSACNRQPYRFVTATNGDDASRLVSCAGGAQGFATNVPAAMAVIGDLSAYAEERDRHAIYIDASLALMQTLLALETLGLASCVINWPEVASQERRIRKQINLARYERVIVLVAVGYALPEGGIPYSQKVANISPYDKQIPSERKTS